MSGLVSGITGAAPIWHDIMSELLQNKTPESIQRPSNVIQKVVCANGLAISGSDKDKCQGRFEYFIKGSESIAGFTLATEKTWVDKTTQAQAAPGQTDNLELKDEQVISDPTGAKYCLSCAHPSPSPTPTL
jgi:membrane carboxypeptidase/penicillin-binding protein